MALTKISGNVVQQNNFSLSGVVTATSFTGDLTGNVTGNVTGTATTATNLADGANITTGTISNDRLPATITKNLTGDVTGNLTGNVTGNVTGNLTGDVTGNVSSSGANTLGSLTVTNDATVGGALTVTGNLTVNGTTTTIDTVVTAIDSLAVDGDVTAGGNLNITGVSTFGGNVDLGDDDILRFGAGQDLQIYHDSANGQSKIVETGPSVLKIQGSDLRLSNAANTADYLQANDGAAVKLFYNGGTAKFETTSAGIKVAGDMNLEGHLDMRDSDRLRFGAGDDLQIFHNGTNNYIDNTSDLYIRVNGSETAIYATANGKVALNYDGNNRFETTLNGAKVTGDLNVTGILTVGQSSVTIDGTNNKITTPKLDYAGISSSISDTAVDVFVYDTRKDSDGGAWRKRTQHTSWYNETLNTATRGSRREFPAVAVIVATTGKVAIYDGDDPDLPLWMRFNQSTTELGAMVGYTSFSIGSVVMLNGMLMVGLDASNQGNVAGLRLINFITEEFSWKANNSNRNSSQHWPIVDRNGGRSLGYDDGNYIVSEVINDVAATVLPNAPIDDATGLPVPTIAVATDGGVSVIRDDGSIFDITGHGASPVIVSFNNNNEILCSGRYPNWLSVYTILTSDITTYGYKKEYIPAVNQVPALDGGPGASGERFKKLSITDYGFAARADQHNLSLLMEEDNQSSESVCYVSSSFNTGWMHGDIKGAFLSDTDATNVTAGSNLIPASSADFSSSSGWTLGTGWTISGGKLNKTTTDNNTASYTVTGLTAGKAYTFSIDVDTVPSSGTIYFYALGQYTIWPSLTTTGTHSLTFVATSTSHAVGITGISGNGCVLDNASVTVGEADRSVNNNGLQVFGTVTKSAVATGAELVAYSGFSGSNALVQPYNSDLDYGTGDFHYMIWIYQTNNTSLYGIISRQTDGQSSGNRFQFQSDTDGLYDLYAGATRNNLGTGGLNVWKHLALVRSGTTMNFYENGILEDSWTDSNNYTNSGANLRVGGLSLGSGINDNRYPNTASSFALFRTGGSAPSAEQIKKIYEDEKMLFQENAACTLYGSSDAVTALAYDDSTSILYAGTSSGRSDFQGLRRINNTTTAVTTAMSASNGLVAEQ